MTTQREVTTGVVDSIDKAIGKCAEKIADSANADEANQWQGTINQLSAVRRELLAK